MTAIDIEEIGQEVFASLSDEEFETWLAQESQPWRIADALAERFPESEHPVSDAHSGLYAKLERYERDIYRDHGVRLSVSTMRQARATAIAWPRDTRVSRASLSRPVVSGAASSIPKRGPSGPITPTAFELVAGCRVACDDVPGIPCAWCSVAVAPVIVGAAPLERLPTGGALCAGMCCRPVTDGSSTSLVGAPMVRLLLVTHGRPCGVTDALGRFMSADVGLMVAECPNGSGCGIRPRRSTPSRRTW